MEFLGLNYREVEHFLFVLLRIAAFIVFVPVLGGRQFLTGMKIGFIVFFSFAVYPSVKDLPFPEPHGIIDLSLYLMLEMMVGIAIAFATRLIFTSVQLAGTIIDFQMGFGVVNVIDPQTETQVSITAQFQNIFSILLYLSLNAHHMTIQAIVNSFHWIVPHQIHFSGMTASYLLKLFVSTFTIAIKIAAPVMAILFFISVGLGLVARTVPQMNVFIVGFPLQIGIGLIMVGFSMTFFGMLFKQQISLLPGWLAGLMKTL